MFPLTSPIKGLIPWKQPGMKIVSLLGANNYDN